MKKYEGEKVFKLISIIYFDTVLKVSNFIFYLCNGECSKKQSNYGTFSYFVLFWYYFDSSICQQTYTKQNFYLWNIYHRLVAFYTQNQFCTKKRRISNEYSLATLFNCRFFSVGGAWIRTHEQVSYFEPTVDTIKPEILTFISRWTKTKHKFYHTIQVCAGGSKFCVKNEDT